MDEGGSNQQQNQQQNDPDFDDAPMGSDHNEEGSQVADDDDIVYLEDDEMAQLEAMADHEEALALAEAAGGDGDEANDFETYQESEFGEGDEYEDGQVLQLTAERNDSIAQFNDHRDSIYCVDTLPVAPFDLFVSGDGDDKAYVWRLVPNEEDEPATTTTTNQPEEAAMTTDSNPNEEHKESSAAAQPKLTQLYKAQKVCELAGHTETVEFCKFDSSGKWLVTGGMNNFLRVWDVKKNFALKQTLENVPQEDLNFVEWHHQAPVLITGGKDFMVWLVNALNGKILASLIGHEEEVLSARFTLEDKGKHIVSISSDKTVRVWSPLSQECVTKIKSFGTASRKLFHEKPIFCLALHPEIPVVLTGDEEGKVYVSQYMTGEVNGIIGEHADSCESIAISKTQPIACSAGIDSKINVYDMTNFTQRLTVTVGQFGGFTKLFWSTYFQNCLVAASTLGDVVIIDPRSGEVVKTIKGHIASVNDVKEFQTADGKKMLVTAGDDNQCLVFDQARIES